MSRFSRVKEYSREAANRYPRLKGYARNILESLQKLKIVIVAIFSDTLRFLKNLILIFVLAILRGVQLLFTNILDALKAAIRAIIDVLRWPLEHIVYPIIHWLADRTERILGAIESRDEVALGFFFMFIILCCLLAVFVSQLF